jgi:hypothetical protein
VPVTDHFVRLRHAFVDRCANEREIGKGVCESEQINADYTL